MNNKFKRILRIAAPVVLCFALVFTVAAPAYAYVDYNDYVSNEKVDGDNDLVTCTIPADDVYWSVVRSGVNYYYGYGSSFVVRQPLPSMISADIYSNWFYDDYLILSNIPNETSISGRFDLKLNFSPESNANSDFQQSIVVHYLDSSGSHISYDVVVSDHVTIPSSGVLGFDIEFPFNFVLNKPDGAAFAYFETRFYFYSGHTGSVTISGSVSDLTLNMSISSLYRLQQQTGKSIELLKEVERQLGEQNDLLDGAINGTVPDSQLPTNSGIIDDYENKENELWDSVSGGLDDANDSFANSSAYVANLTGTFAFVAAMCNDLWLIEPFGSLLHVSLSLGVTASILGLGYLAARSSSRSGSSGRRKKGGG